MGLVELARFGSRIEADLARLALEAHGIDAVLMDAETNSFFGAGGLIPVRLMIFDEDRAEALEILRGDAAPPPG